MAAGVLHDVGLRSAPPMTVVLDTARLEWEESHRLLESHARDRRRYERLLEQVDAVTAELRRRVGQTFTLAHLARASGYTDHWARDAVAEAEPPPEWPLTPTLVTGAAFHSY